MTSILALPIGTELLDKYRIERVLGAGGFGITYLARDATLDRAVTIKEYFPPEHATRNEQLDAVPQSSDSDEDFRWGLERFASEAKTLARFDHPNIVKVYDYFPASNTGYMVLQFEEGQSLRSWMKGLGRAPRQKELDRIVPALLDALAYIHDADFLHRDIAPDNIIIRDDGSPVLIDFGSARGDIAKRTRTISALVKPGYSPYEQYSETEQRQGPWTDIYALGATLYHVVSGRRPPDSPSRVVRDTLVPAREAALSSYRPGFLNAIDRALVLDPGRRPQSVAAWRGDLLAPDQSKSRWFKRPAENAPADSLAASPAIGAVPPPPDAPAGQGLLVDFIDGLKKKAEPPPVPAEPPEPPAAAEPAPPAEPQPPAARKQASNKPAAVRPETRRPANPRPLRTGSRRARVAFLMKLAVGIAVASTAVAFQDRIAARFDTRILGAASPAARDQLLTGELKGHKGPVTAVGFSDDGRWLVSAGADGTMRTWDARSGAPRQTVTQATSPATSLAVAGGRVVTGHEDGSVVLTDLAKGEKLATFRRNEASIWSVAIAAESGKIIAASHDWTVTIWNDKLPGAPEQVLTGHDSAVQAVAYDRSGPYIASGSADRTVKLWQPGEANPVRTYKGHRDFVTALGFAPDGRQLASASLDGAIRIWSTASSRLFRSFGAHRTRVNSLVYAPSGDLLASAGEDGLVKIWDMRRSRPVRVFQTGGPAVKSIAYTPDGRRVAGACADGTVRLWDATVAMSRSRDE